MKAAIYPVSLDPVTNGHVWMMGKGASLFDRLFVLVATNPNKAPAFTLEERILCAEDAARSTGRSNITVIAADGAYTVDVARRPYAGQKLLNFVDDGVLVARPWHVVVALQLHEAGAWNLRR